MGNIFFSKFLQQMIFLILLLTTIRWPLIAKFFIETGQKGLGLFFVDTYWFLASVWLYKHLHLSTFHSNHWYCQMICPRNLNISKQFPLVADILVFPNVSGVITWPTSKENKFSIFVGGNNFWKLKTSCVSNFHRHFIYKCFYCSIKGIKSLYSFFHTSCYKGVPLSLNL